MGAGSMTTGVGPVYVWQMAGIGEHSSFMHALRCCPQSIKWPCESPAKRELTVLVSMTHAVRLLLIDPQAPRVNVQAFDARHSGHLSGVLAIRSQARTCPRLWSAGLGRCAHATYAQLRGEF